MISIFRYKSNNGGSVNTTSVLSSALPSSGSNPGALISSHMFLYERNPLLNDRTDH